MTLGLAAFGGYVPEARADEVPTTGKGVAGGALLGAEVITITEAIAGVKPGWAYWLGGGIGLVGGGVGGYFVEQNTSDAKIPVFMLAGGIALIIPALVLSLNATRYEHSEITEDRAPTGPTPEPGAVGGSVVIGGGSTPPGVLPGTPPPAPAPAPVTPPSGGGSSGPPRVEPHGNGGGALLDLGDGSMRIGVPVPHVRPMYSMQQMKELGLPQGTEYRLPVVHVTF